MEETLKIYSLAVILAVLLVSFDLCQCDKYDEDLNRPGMRKRADDKNPFRARKVTQVWEKALRVGMAEPKLAELKIFLKKLDDKYLTIKKDEKMNSVDGMAETKEYQQILDKQLTEAMRRFDLIPSDRLTDNDYGTKTDQQHFTDRRVNGLWIQALKEKKFNEVEMAQLREELLHHQGRQEEFDLDMKLMHGDAKETNEIRRDNRGPEGKHVERAKNIDLKIKHRELSRDFQRLSAKVHLEEDKGGFTEHRVINLWKEAQRSNFSEKELDSIKEELQHFEKKLIRSEDLHMEVLKSEREAMADLYMEKDRRPIDWDIEKNVKSKESMKSKMKASHSLREEMSQLGSQVADFMRSFKDRLARVGRKHMEL